MYYYQGALNKIAFFSKRSKGIFQYWKNLVIITFDPHQPANEGDQANIVEMPV
jgi:hypothetical protein